MLVVVPTQTGRYLPEPIFCTLGAVWSKAAPCQSTGGGTCWSNTRIMFASRTPNTTPSSSTESPTRNCRTSASVRGVLKRYSLMSESHFHRAVGAELGAAAFCPPALKVHRHGIAGDMRPGRLDVDPHRRRVGAQALRSDAGLIDSRQQLLFEGGQLRVGIADAQGPQGCLFRQGHADRKS